jgi:hypothetical protein
MPIRYLSILAMCEETTYGSSDRSVPVSLNECAASGPLLLFDGSAYAPADWKWLVTGAPLLPSYSRDPGVC